MNFGNRQGIIVWVHSLKQVKQLKRFGNIHYVSKKLKYVVIYMDMDRIEETAERIKSLSFVKKVELSYKPFLKTEYENSKPDKAKEYDYKIGI
ncbi:YlbG family protein [Schinkia sp. CFF1]